MAAPRTKVKASGFTIVEIMIVITIATVLATVVLPGLIAQNQDKLVERIAEDYRALEQAVLVYYMQGEDGGWPTPACGEELEQGTLVANGYLGQVLMPPQSDEEYYIASADNQAGDSCNIIIASPQFSQDLFEPLFSALETAISGLSCTPGWFSCKKTLSESLIVNFAAGGGGGSSSGGSIFEQLEEACCTTVSTKGKANNCPAGIMKSVLNEGAWAECCTPPPCPPL